MEKSIKSNSINYGLILGASLALFTVICYVAKIELLVNFWIMMLIIPLLIIVVGIISTAKSKSLLNGFISFKQAFTAYFITVSIGVIISTIVSVVIFNYVDPEAANYLKEILIEKTTSFMESVGATASDIEDAIKPMEEQNTFAIGTQLRSLAQSLIFFIVIGLIVALSMKKTDPNLE